MTTVTTTTTGCFVLHASNPHEYDEWMRLIARAKELAYATLVAKGRC